MSTISKYFDYARLADAAYVDLSSVAWSNPALVADRAVFVTKLPRKLADATFSNDPTGWKVAHYYDTENPINGFAATLFKSNETQPRYVLGIRGTELEGSQFGLDLLWADLKEIGFVGMTVTQATAMVNYILRLQAPAGATNVLQFDLQTSISPIRPNPSALGRAGGWFWLAPRNNGVGLGAIPTGATIDVTGHSLGAHLAALTTRLFPALVNEAVAFNSPGYDPTTAGTIVRAITPAIGAIPSAVLSAIGPEQRLTDEVMLMFRQYLPGVGDFFSGVTSLESEDSAAGDDFDLVSGQLTGTPFGAEQSVAVEKNSHSMSQIVDSLTLQRMFYQLDPTSALASFEALYRNASNEDRTAVEALLVALERQLVNPVAQNSLPVVEAGTGFPPFVSAGDFASRTAWYDRWQPVETGLQPLANKLQITALNSATNLTLTAPTDFGQFIALKTLSPFALKALPGQQSTLSDVWNTVHSGDYAAWTADALARASGAEPTFSDFWYADRSMLLSAVLKRNETNDTDNDVTLAGLPQGVANVFEYFQDGTAPILIARPQGSAPAPSERLIMFADDSGRTLNGSDVNSRGDRLYGGRGNDIISGFRGDDYLEGNAGADRLDGGTQRDLLLGGAGIDELFGGDGDDYLLGGPDSDLRLQGGLGRDRLEGGAGFDNYYLNTNDTAVDVIVDADVNSGRLFVDDVLIGGFIAIRDGLYQSTSGGLYRLAVVGDAATGRSASLYRTSDNKALAAITGITGTSVLGYLLPAPAAPPAPVATYNRGAASDVYRAWYLQGNGTLLPPAPGRAVADGGGANDFIVGSTHAQVEIFGGLGNDVLEDLRLPDANAEAAQLVRLSGGAGSDFLYGAGGTMYLDGGDNNDFISSARFNSAPSFEILTRDSSGTWITPIAEEPSVLADMGALLSLTPTTINQAVGSYDTTQQRWNFYYRPFASGSVAAGRNLVGDGVTTPHSIAVRRLADGRIDWLAPSFYNEPGSLPVVNYSTTWTTNPQDPLQAAFLTVTRTDGLTANGLILHSLVNPQPTTVQDGNSNRTELAFINAGTGDDIVFGGAGKDIVDGGTGADRIDGAGGEDVIDGGVGDDFIVGGRFNDFISGGADNDILHGGGESDTLYGGGGSDVLLGDFYDNLGPNGTYRDLQPPGDDYLDGGDGNDSLDGGLGRNVLHGGRGNDVLLSNLGTDVMYGGDDDDILISNLAIGDGDLLDGGAGNDAYVFLSNLTIVCDQISSVDGTGSTVIRDTSGNDTIETNFHRMSLPEGVENLTLDGYAVNGGTLTALAYDSWGRDSRARYVGNDANNIIDASMLGQNANFLQSFLGGVVIDGGAGADTMTGSWETSDTYIVDNSGDVVVETTGTIPGSNARDRIVTPFATNLSGSLQNLEEVQLVGADAVGAVGNASDNTLIGSTNSASNNLSGLAGNDLYRVDLLDTVVESAGGGIDTLSIDGATLSVGSIATISLANYANFENLEVFKGLARVNFNGSSVDNRLSGSAGGGMLDGAAGNDTLIDFDISPYWDWVYQRHLNAPINGAHILRGGAGNDSLTSYGGADTLDGGLGNDVLRGFNGSIDVVFGGGYGQDSLSVSNAVGSGTLRWTESTDFSTLRSTRLGNNLQLSLGGGADRLDLANYYSTIASSRAEFSQWRVGEQLFLSRSVIDAFVTAGAPGTASAAGDFLATTAAGGSINAGAGNDVLLGANGADVLSGDIGDDSIAAGAGNDTLQGGDGADRLDGGSGNDQLTGGAGNDEVTGGAGNDLIRFNAGSGQDRIKNNLLETVDGTDTLRFDASVTAASVSISADNADGLVISITGGDQIVVEGSQRDFGDNLVSQGFSWTAGDLRSTLDRIEFSDGTFWTHADILNRARIRIGTPGNDTLIAPHGVSMQIDGLAGNDVITGRDGNDTLIGGAGYDQINGGDGNDNIDGGADGGWLRGDAGDDTLIGGTGQDQLDGGTGADVMTGGAGNDYYILDDAGDVVVEQAGGGTDTVSVDRDYVLGSNLENLFLGGFTGLRGEGNSVANTIFGTGGHDTLIGAGGADYVDGLGGDDLYIGAGDGDTFVVTQYGGPTSSTLTVDNVAAAGTALGTLQFSEIEVLPGDLVVTRGTGAQTDDLMIALRGTQKQIVVKNHFLVTAGQRRNGISSVRYADGYTIDRAGIDALVGLAPANGAALGANTLYGTAAGESLTGTASGDRIFGLAGNDFLSGGAGADTLAGGIGDDYYFVDHVNDYVYEAPGAGTDSMNASVSYTLQTDVENIYLTGTDNINATGNALANFVFGNTGNNQITGGAGNDYLDGGAGTDALAGGDGNDSLNGGTGSDSMLGGLGNDTYHVDAAGDVVTENAGEGTDMVQASVTYTIGANIETLFLTGTAAINGSGNASDNGIYGNSAANVLSGGAGNDTLSGGTGADSMSGGAGNDIFYVDNAADVTTELASEGTDTAYSTLTWTLANNVENLVLTGTAATNGTGNALNNSMSGNTAANRLDGGGGADSMFGSAGNDVYVVDNSADIASEGSNAGTDLVEASASFTLGANVENITLTGTAAINATGNASNNTLTGNAGTNRLSGGGSADTMIGGAGNDTYVVDGTTDVVTEGVSAGTDMVESSITYTLGANVENLTLTGTAAINATGNTLANALTGNSGANQLNGGTGADTMTGGAGSDIYVVDNIADVVTEAASAGTDRIDSSVTFTLGANVENLTLTGTAAINGIGNTLNNALTGNTGANRLDGGAGNDTMAGGTGDDVYVVDSATDVVTEAASAGTDRVESSITYTLGSNVENLVLTGSAAINATGNTLVNTLTGNSGANVLNGGAGADTMSGGLGDDIYVVDNAADVVTEAASAGIDRIDASITTTLGLNVENLTLTGTTAINGTGNTLNNSITGNVAANVLNGGAGNDTLTDSGGVNVFVGGAGNDTLNVTSTGVDRIAMARGHGIDTVIGTGTAANDVLEVSNGIAKSAMALMKTGNDLVVDLGAGETLTLRNWYAGVRNVGTLKIIGDVGWVPGQTGTPTQVETLTMASLAAAFDAARLADPTLTRWPLDSFGGGSFAAISDTRIGAGNEDLINPIGRAGVVTGSKFSQLASEPVRAVRTTPRDDGISQLVTLSAPYSPNLSQLETVMQPNLKSFMKFWNHQVPADLPTADWYGEPLDTEADVTGTTADATADAQYTTGDMVRGAPRAISVAAVSDGQTIGTADGWAHALPAARMPMPDDAFSAQELARIQPAARSAPWWESSENALEASSYFAGKIERSPALAMPFAWESVHSELTNQLTHTSESALGEQVPQSTWSSITSSGALGEGVGLQHAAIVDDAQRVVGRLGQRLR